MNLFSHKEELVKRTKAFGWHLSMMVVAATVAFVLQNLNMLNLPEWSVVLLGLILGQTSKYINNWLSLNS